MPVSAVRLSARSQAAAGSCGAWISSAWPARIITIMVWGCGGMWGGGYPPPDQSGQAKLFPGEPGPVVPVGLAAGPARGHLAPKLPPKGAGLLQCYGGGVGLCAHFFGCPYQVSHTQGRPEQGSGYFIHFKLFHGGSNCGKVAAGWLPADVIILAHACWAVRDGGDYHHPLTDQGGREKPPPRLSTCWPRTGTAHRRRRSSTPRSASHPGARIPVSRTTCPARLS